MLLRYMHYAQNMAMQLKKAMSKTCYKLTHRSTTVTYYTVSHKKVDPKTNNYNSIKRVSFV